MLEWIAIGEALVKLLKGTGVIKTPEDELKAKIALAEIAAKQAEAEARMEEARAEEFARFMEATQPKSSDVPTWVNGVISLVRPSMAIFTLVTLVMATERWALILDTLARAGIWGVLGISPAIVWVLGRDGLRMILGVVGTIKSSGYVPPEALPPGVPSRPAPPAAPKPAVLPKPAVKPRPVWNPPDLGPVEGDNR